MVGRVLCVFVASWQSERSTVRMLPPPSGSSRANFEAHIRRVTKESCSRVCFKSIRKTITGLASIFLCSECLPACGVCSPDVHHVNSGRHGSRRASSSVQRLPRHLRQRRRGLSCDLPREQQVLSYHRTASRVNCRKARTEQVG